MASGLIERQVSRGFAGRKATAQATHKLSADRDRDTNCAQSPTPEFAQSRSSRRRATRVEHTLTLSKLGPAQICTRV